MVDISSEIKIGERKIGLRHPAYFIADIAANHDGDLARAKQLIYLAAKSGADAAKFQHFKAETIVSNKGFVDLGSRKSHQSKWKKPVFEIYKDASLDVSWTPVLKETCDDAGIHFISSPYSFELVDEIYDYVPAYKIGSGDITWLEIIRYMAGKNKPVLIATGASTFHDVTVAVDEILKINSEVVLMQCNTNYTGSIENLRYVNLNVLETFRERYPDIVLGLSDHTPRHATVLGSIALGARVIEKHFTDDVSRTGPDHCFSMDPSTWKEMVDRSRELEAALGSGKKIIEGNEKETVVVQRRSVRATVDLPKGTKLKKEHLVVLRPCPEDGLAPSRLSDLIGKVLAKDYESGEHIRWKDLK